MNTFVDAIDQTIEETRTENDMKTYDTSMSKNVDLFFKIGASRVGQEIRPLFEKAYQENPTLTQKILLWARDIRGGAGERAIVRELLQYMDRYHHEDLIRILPAIPEVGRWDDLLVLISPEAQRTAYELIKNALQQGNGLCAKWMPRKGKQAATLRAYLGWTPKVYRKTLVGLSNTVEQKMCAGDWESIEFGKLPSVASARYQKAFGRHVPLQYGAYIDGLQKGTEKINAAAVYPYDIIRSVRNGNQHVALAQWNALPNYMTDASIVPLVDVSGSMDQTVSGSITAMDVAVSLGLYCADKNTGPFKDTFLTFSSLPQLLHLKGDLLQKMNQMESSDWGMGTDLHAAFAKILSHATQNKILQKDMPHYLLIMSDMEFNGCVRYDDSAIQMIRRKYHESGYEIPNVIFWNLNSRTKNVPVKFTDKGVGLISGFSPAIMTAVLGGEVDPEAIMLRAVDVPRYRNFVEPTLEVVTDVIDAKSRLQAEYTQEPAQDLKVATKKKRKTTKKK